MPSQTIDEPSKLCNDIQNLETRIITTKVLTESQRIVLVSSDGYQFVIHQRVAQFSGLLNNIMKFQSLYPITKEQKFQETATRIFHFDQIPATILEKVCRYMYYKSKYSNNTEDFPEFDLIDEENAADLFLVADYLDI